METISKRRPYYSTFALILGVWFAITSWIWVYYVNIVIAFPAAIVGLLLWNKGRKAGENRSLNKTALIVHIFGFVVSIVALLALTIAN
jgi:hypothetical protein